MNFYDTVTEMGYKVIPMDDIIEIYKEDDFPGHDPLGEIRIVFYNRTKKILGYVKPVRNLYNLDDLSHIYHTLYLNMKKDLKFFKEKSKYEEV